ncbi:MULTISPECIES: sensor histidine kinase [unclassified Streptomyces]|uniref:sensor histidine kinase n=1 Tax=unclassified Streptomyces TaxID=2593676 RepID=UPI0038168442
MGSGRRERSAIHRPHVLGLVRDLCLALALLGTVAYAVDAVAEEPLPVRPVAALAVASATGVLAVMARAMPKVRVLLAMVACGFAALTGSWLFRAEAGYVALAFLLAAVVYSVLAWPEARVLLGQGRARALLGRQEHYAGLIAGELHDEVLQLLALTRRQLDAALTEEDPDVLRASVRKAMGRLDELASVLRSIVATLHPVALRGLGLAETVRSLAARVAAENGLIVDVNVQGDRLGAPMANDEACLAAYRVVQEALSNVVKHADAEKVRVSLEYRHHHVVLSVTDDGCGLSHTSPATVPGYGVEGMRWRCEAYGGTFSLTSGGTGCGTTVRAAIPVPCDRRSV